MTPNGSRRATSGEGGRGAGVFSADDARENTPTPYFTQGDLVVIKRMVKNKREQLRIALDRFQGVHLVDIRVTVDLTEASGVQTPTKKGISLKVDMLPGLIEALLEAQAEAQRRGLFR